MLKTDVGFTTVPLKSLSDLECERYRYFSSFKSVQFQHCPSIVSDTNCTSLSIEKQPFSKRK